MIFRLIYCLYEPFIERWLAKNKNYFGIFVMKYMMKSKLIYQSYQWQFSRFTLCPVPLYCGRVCVGSMSRHLTPIFFHTISWAFVQTTYAWFPYQVYIRGFLPDCHYELRLYSNINLLPVSSCWQSMNTELQWKVSYGASILLISGE